MELLNSNKERIQSNIFVNTQVLSVIRNLCFCVTIYCMTFFRDVQRCKYFYFIAFLRRALCFFSSYGDFMIVYCMSLQRFLQIGTFLFFFITSNSQIGLHNRHSNCNFTCCIVAIESAIPRAKARKGTFTLYCIIHRIRKCIFTELRRASNECT